MFNSRILWLFVIVAVLLPLLDACDSAVKGTLAENKAPETSAIVDTIIRSGPNRLNSEVHIRWWGDDPDGFVQGFEIAFDNGDWSYTELYDSIFILSPPPGHDTSDFKFMARAIDNNGATDPTPAKLTYPVKNSPPTIQYIPGLNNPVKTFPVIKLYWEGNDPDGFLNLNRYEIVWNDTNRVLTPLDITVSSATFSAVDVNADSSECEIFLNNNDQPETFLLKGLMLNDTNRLYIRSVDNSEAKSRWLASYPIFVKKVDSDILMINAYSTGITAIEDFYTQRLINQGITDFDTIRIFENIGGSLTQQSPDNITQARIFELFDYIIWYGNDAGKSLSLAQKTTSDFFNNGGKMMMAVYVSSTFDEQSQFLEFTPATGLINPKDTTLILDNGGMVHPMLATWPQLKSTSIIGVVKPMILAAGSQAVYNSDLIARDDNTAAISPWGGISTVLSLRKQNSVTDFVFSTLELERLDGNNNIDSLFQKVLIDEFGL